MSNSVYKKLKPLKDLPKVNECHSCHGYWVSFSGTTMKIWKWLSVPPVAPETYFRCDPESDVEKSYDGIQFHWKKKIIAKLNKVMNVKVEHTYVKDTINTSKQGFCSSLKRSIHHLAAQGELFLGNVDHNPSDFNGIDQNGFTPLMWAAAYGQVETVRQLINLGASVSTLAPTGENALLFASAGGHCTIIKELLNHGAPIDYKDKEGNTALMYAVYNDHGSCVQELLNAGADFTLQNEAVESAYDIAIRRRSKHAQLVLEKCALSLLKEAKESS